MLFGLQLGFTFVVLVGIYMLFALLDYTGGFDSFIGFIVFQPVIAAVLSVLTIILCFIIGLPIRFNRTVNQWWTKNFIVAFMLAIVGFTFLILSVLPLFTEVVPVTIDKDSLNETIPNGWFAITGWFVTAFALLHTFPPYILKQKTITLLNTIKL
ncbi:hypothetical protein JAO76_13080 [Pontibacter sp. BT310]|uniref:DUF2798 domain-containing protein n=1 Tax=Pontibacter populi TaxID=890055 RepID=A0ABS6XDF2_9BACT|nr:MULTISPECIES: hypothetical protein [Pontibacter]MBJ6119135.1 hypothetical protein [Pontibacter sp. BT310]MBR0571563.1 hypothetical protein [Microvirga sp. STS03]MBW3365989.1 hypothetical protein [Pontibacter populi]